MDSKNSIKLQQVLMNMFYWLSNEQKPAIWGLCPDWLCLISYIISLYCVCVNTCIVLELFMKSEHAVDITRDEAYRSMPARDKQCVTI